tara:strand:+ start:731 stop:1132 length:402 start_codon:yes stop_codon:yes gene_type:complete
MENKFTEIASSNQGFPIFNQFLDEVGAKDAAVDFAKNFVKDRFNKRKENRNEIELDPPVTTENFINTIDQARRKTRNLINAINQAGITADLSGVGFEKTFGDKNQGINTTIFGRQNFGQPTQYGARLGFNYKF